MSQDTDEIARRLEQTRRRLLDLTRANRLLNHRPRGQRTLRIVEERPAQVFDLLVNQLKTMQFLAREEAPPELAGRLPPEDDPDREIPAGLENQRPALSPDQVHELSLPPIARGHARGGPHEDRCLQTLLPGPKLQTRLVKLAREATSSLQEQGANILYLTLGVVKWRESDASPQDTCAAPLLFIPVSLSRPNVQTRHGLALFDDDILVNPCLLELCRRQFRFELPMFDPEAEDVDLEQYQQQVCQSLTQMPGWSYEPQINLGLFSFSKLLMYRDLDPKNWPAEKHLARHPLIRLFSGESIDTAELGEPIPDPACLDETVRPNDCYQVVDADSSQQAAILAAKRGGSIVIEGPPGTGKSQTITNIIAECLSEGRSVLFVAEKSAALEVVKRRLENVGLGDFVLELHSRKASKKAVLEELRRVLERRDRPRVMEVDAAELERVRQQLNDYRKQLHTPISRLNLSPFQVIGRASALADEPEAVAQLADVFNWTAQDLSDAREKLSRLDARLTRTGDPSHHPWRGVRLDNVDLHTRQQVVAAARSLAVSPLKLLESARSLALCLGAHEPRTVAQIQTLLNDAALLLDAPVIAPGLVADERWDCPTAELKQWLADGIERSTHKARWAAAFHPDAEMMDWTQVLHRRRVHGGSILRILRPSWRRDTASIRSRLLDPARLPPLQEQIGLLEALVSSARLRQRIESLQARYAPQFGDAWRGIDGEFQHLGRLADTLPTVRQAIRASRIQLDAAQRILGSDRRDDLRQAAAQVRQDLQRLGDDLKHWLNVVRSDEQTWLRQPLAQTNLAELHTRVASLPGQIDLLQDWADLRLSYAECSDPKFVQFTKWALAHDRAATAGHLVNIFDRHFYRTWLDAAFAQLPALRSFRGQDHKQLVERFRGLDTEWLRASRARLSALVAEKRPDFDHAAHRQSMLGIVQAEIRKKARHMPLRKLLAVAGDVIKAVKPCFMMSPLSVAQYLEPGRIEFDVVIFDEASQVEPADAYGAVARGRQLILVGDERQLPPTPFFTKLDLDDSTDGDEESAQVLAGDLESILSLGVVRLPARNRSMLRWHYRSRHASLISFSNHKFYDDLLRVFPSPHTDCSELGLAFHFVPDGVYYRGTGRHNPREAQLVARAVIQHAIEHPGLSLGVGTLNLPQQRAIEDEIERLRRQEPDDRVEQFFAAHEQEPFFVKNLENIQGDERDVIFISIGYGKDPSGHMTAHFGALNADGGWRRLNVLVTRARRRCVVFSSIRSDDIDLSKTQARGVVALKEYLYAAEHGRLIDLAPPGADHHSPFEAEVCRALRDRGWTVHAQVGCAGFAIDLAVVDPNHPGRYLLGIECDGATYHSSPTARDRDRLRQEVLERLGWKVQRIWSTDWFRRRDQIIRDLHDQLARVRDEPPAAPAARNDRSAPAAPPIVVAGASDLPEHTVGEERVLAGSSLRRRHERLVDPESIRPQDIRQAILTVLAKEFGMSAEALVQRTARYLGFGRAGRRIAEDIEQQIESLLRQEQICRDDHGVLKLCQSNT